MTYLRRLLNSWEVHGGHTPRHYVDLSDFCSQALGLSFVSRGEGERRLYNVTVARRRAGVKGNQHYFYETTLVKCPRCDMFHII